MDATIITGTLPDPFCHISWQDTYEQMMAVTRVTVPTANGIFVKGPNPPADHTVMWFSTTDYRWYYPDLLTSKWISLNPIPPGNAVQMWMGSPTDLVTYDGGTALATGENGTATKGPMWEIVAEMAGFTPVGVGKVGGATDGTDIPLAGTIGQEWSGVLPDHKHGIGALYSERNTDSVWPPDATFTDAGVLRHESPGVTIPSAEEYSGYAFDAAYKSTIKQQVTKMTKCTFLTTVPVDDPSLPTKITNMQPSKGIYFIRRTSRVFYAIDF